ncbi:MAG: heparinase II/III family protein [Pseudomonadota bacterium]
MIKQLTIVATVIAATLAGPALAQFTPRIATYTATELSATAAALSPASLSSAIDTFDATTPTMGHPRLFKGQADFAGIVAATRAERRSSITALGGYLRRNSVANASAALKSQIASNDASVRMSSWWQQNRILEGMAEAGVAWYITRDAWFLNEMRARMNLFAPAVVARGCAGDVAETRDYVWFYALAYDFAYAGMTAADRTTVKNVLLACGNASLKNVHDTVTRYPENGIAFNALGKFVGALLIVRGDMPELNPWLRTSLPAYVASVSPWGGDDGGFANGSTYAEWDAGESLIMWDLVERVLNVPFYRKPWLTEFARFIAYSLPPGTPVGVFGDGAESNRNEDWARFGKAIMNRSDTTLSRWYVKQQAGEDYARLHILLSPREYGSAVALPGTQPNGAYFPIVGWAAMHSALGDRLRTSAYFKSSPFGSVNHSHADQNSFVFYSKGKVLAMDSGVYDYYNSPHWRNYYKQTRAHNAITFDGGQGQSLGATGLGDRAAAGRLTRFQQSAAYDIASGDASAAYAGKLSQARRTVIFIRPGTLVTVDQLASDTPRKYEYNLHTPVAMNGTSADFRGTNAPAEMCGQVASPDVIVKDLALGYYPAPAVATPPHYWNKFIYYTRKTRGLFVAVLRANCQTAKENIVFGSAGATITVGGRVITVTDADVTVQ